jgi:hypothetical protein
MRITKIYLETKPICAETTSDDFRAVATPPGLSKYSPEWLRGLVPYRPGQSGNPGRHRKGIPSSGHASARLQALSPAERAVYTPSNGAEEIALAQIKEAIAGEVHAAKEITNRIDGPVERQVVIESPNEFQARLRIMRVRDCGSSVMADHRNLFH